MFSLTAGVSEDAPLNDHIKSQKAKKNAIYRQFAQQYVGYDKDHNVIEFNISGTTQPESGYSLLGSPEMAVQALRPLLALVLKLLFLWTFPGC